MGGEGMLALEQVPRLLSLAYNLKSGEWSKHQSAMMRAIMAEIRVHHTRPGLTAKMVAEDLGISRRHLYAIMEKHGTSFLRALQSVRLERAAQMFELHPWSETKK
jgi:AraC-like DNA-binding protein